MSPINLTAPSSVVNILGFYGSFVIISEPNADASLLESVFYLTQGTTFNLVDISLQAPLGFDFMLMTFCSLSLPTLQTMFWFPFS